MESEAPMYRKHIVFYPPDGSDFLSHFGFLPGGKLGVIIQNNGSILIYDFRSPILEDEGAGLEGSDETPAVAGLLLGKYCVGFPVDVFDFQLGDDDGRYIIIAVSSWS